MAKGTELDGFFSEYNIKDNATKSIKKIDKEEKKLTKTVKSQTKDLDKNQKEIKQSSNALNKYAKEAKKANAENKKFAKSLGGMKGKVGKAGGKAAGGAGKVAGGGGIGSAFAGIPIIGGLLAGVFASVSKQKSNFVAGLALKTEIEKFTNDYQLAFRGQARTTIASFNERLYSERDIQASLTGLSDIGVTATTTKQYQSTIEAFTKSQGFTTLSEGINALVSGQIKAGRGVSKEDSALIQNIASSMLGNQFSADEGFKLIAEILKKSSITEMLASANISKASQEMTERRRKKDEFITKDAMGKEEVADVSDKIVIAMNQVVKKIASAKGSLALVKGAATGFDVALSGLNVLGDAISAISNFFTGGNSTSGKATGGPVKSRTPILVGEKGPEIFTPKSQGNISTNLQSKKMGGGGGSINVVFNINGVTDPLTVAKIVQEKFISMLNSYANTVLSRELNLSVGMG